MDVNVLATNLLKSVITILSSVHNGTNSILNTTSTNGTVLKAVSDPDMSGVVLSGSVRLSTVKTARVNEAPAGNAVPKEIFC